MNKSELRKCQCDRCEARVNCMRSREVAEEARSATIALATIIFAAMVGVICMCIGAWLW